MKHFLINVGALTSKPYAFTARPWELKKFNTIDLFDSMGSSIIVDVRNSEIMRITPQINNTLNEEWITDKARFAYDLINKWRFVTPLIKTNEGFVNINWEQAFSLLLKKLSAPKTLVKIYLGKILDLETTFLVKKLLLKSKNMMLSNTRNIFHFPNELKDFTRKGTYVLYNLNIRLVNPLLNLKLRRNSINNKAVYFFVGSTTNKTIYAKHLGITGNYLVQLLRAKKLRNSKEITIITALTEMTNEINSLAPKVYGLCQYHSESANRALSLNERRPAGQFDTSINYYVGQFFDLDLNGYNIIQSSYVSTSSSKKFDMVLPTLNWFEEEQSYLNGFSFLQKTSQVIAGPKQARSSKNLLKLLLKEKTTSTLDLSGELGLNKSVLQKVSEPFNRKFIKLSSRPKALDTYDYHLSAKFLSNSISMTKASREFFKGKNDFLTVNN